MSKGIYLTLLPISLYPISLGAHVKRLSFLFSLYVMCGYVCVVYLYVEAVGQLIL